MTHPVIADVTARIAERSADQRQAYLNRLAAAAETGPARGRLACANLAHGFAASGTRDKSALRRMVKPNIAIVSSYNDMLSAHKPFESYPKQLKQAVLEAGGIAQFAGGVPAMCDGITQGRDGMQLSLFSRDVIAMATAIALSHDMFDGALLLGVCDKIVPGMLIGALGFGHLPVLFVPAGPMTSGLPNTEKSKIRQLHAEGKVGRDALLDAEAASYHGSGTCTFYGTANSNQLLMEAMGLHLPGTSLVNPDTPLRDALTAEAGRQVTGLTALGDRHTPVGHVVDERAVVNGCVALLATGGSTNHTMHLVAIARAAGITLSWNDIADLSAVVPLLARVYPNGPADVNHFHAAGGMGFVIGSLLGAGLMHPDVRTVAGDGLHRYTSEPRLDSERAEVGRRRQGKPRHGGIAWRRRSVRTRWWLEDADRKPRHGSDQDLGGGSATSNSHRACRRVRQPGSVPLRLPIRFAGPRSRGGPALPGPAGPRHAGTAQAHACAGRAAGPRPPGGTGHRRPHVGRLRKGARRNPSHPRGGHRWADGPRHGRRRHHARRRRQFA